MTVDKNGLAMATAKDLLSKFVGELAILTADKEIERLCAKMLHNAYCEGWNAATKRVSTLAIDLNQNGPVAKSFVEKTYD